MQKRSTHAHVHLSVLSPVGGAEPPAVELALAAMEAQTRTCVYIVPFISPQRTRQFLNRDRRARQRWLFMCDAPLADPEDGDMHEADMDEPADAEPTAAEYQSFFDSIMALP